jgi:hypothetical protein
MERIRASGEVPCEEIVFLELLSLQHEWPICHLYDRANYAPALAKEARGQPIGKRMLEPP